MPPARASFSVGPSGKSTWEWDPIMATATWLCCRPACVPLPPRQVAMTPLPPSLFPDDAAFFMPHMCVCAVVVAGLQNDALLEAVASEEGAPIPS
jgi:hypothetical protein